MTLIDLVRLILRAWRFVLVGSVIGAVLAGVAAYFTPHKFIAEVVVAPAGAAPGTGLSSMLGQLGGLASIAGINIGGSSGDDLGKNLALLKSRTFTVGFIKRHNLMPVLFAKDWDAARSTWSVADPRDTPTEQDAFEVFDERVRSIREDRKMGMYVLRIYWTDPVKAAEWANAMIGDLNAEARAVALREAQAQVDYLTAELAKTEVVGARQSINNVLESQIQSISLSSARPDYAFKIIDPAVVPDRDRYRWPMPGLMVAVGAVLGMLVGTLLALLRRAPATP